MGGCELRLQGDGLAHVSYWTSAAERGRGYAARGLVLLQRYALSVGVSEVEAHIAVDNHASRRVAERAGLSRADTFSADDGTDMIRYRIDLGYATGSTSTG